jgi:hypothetical protein
MNAVLASTRRLGGRVLELTLKKLPDQRKVLTKVDESEVTPSLKLAKKPKAQADCQETRRGRVDFTKKLSDKVVAFGGIWTHANWPRFRWKAPAFFHAIVLIISLLIVSGYP